MVRRITWIDFLRLLGIIGVLTMHICGNTLNTFGLDNTSKQIYYFMIYISEYAVPLFIMISGIMFLNKENLTIKSMLKKYVLKVLIGIFLFGIFFSSLELIYDGWNLNLNFMKEVFIRIISGNTWAHMWYLYLIFGLYLITPILRILSKNMNKNEYKYFLIIMYIFCILIPELSKILRVEIAFSISGISGYIFYYFWGYYLYNFGVSKVFKKGIYAISFIAIIFLFLKSLKDNNLDMLSYTSNIPFLISTSIILFLKNKKFGDAISKVLSQIGINSYGIYIFHQLFINIIYKLLKFDFIRIYPLIGFCIYLIFIFVLSYFTTYILRRIKLISKYVI